MRCRLTCELLHLSRVDSFLEFPLVIAVVARFRVSLTPDAVLLRFPSTAVVFSLHTTFTPPFHPPTFTLTTTTSRLPRGKGLKNIPYYRLRQVKGFFIPLGKEGRGVHKEGCWRDEKRRGVRAWKGASVVEKTTPP
jgi:hypothetical protein